ncbi:hypothetical protein ABT124_18815 [Streptomyces sp. NPDC001982]|uniref:hypothetical protein n=1 Tax=unclassified Streptomyces TaxID=2593676 RepID=UPI00331976B9
MSQGNQNSDGGPVTSFGVPMGGTLFHGGPWTAWRSVLIGLLGLAGLGLGVAYASWGIGVVSGLVLLVAAVWLRAAVRSHRDAHRLERRAARASRD